MDTYGPMEMGKSIACYPSESKYHREDNSKEADRMTDNGHKHPLSLTTPDLANRHMNRITIVVGMEA